MSTRLFSNDDDDDNSTVMRNNGHSIRKVAIVGGGLAGLSTAFHLIDKTGPGSLVSIYDKAPVGMGGASSVAGGYVLEQLLLSFSLLACRGS